MSGTSLGDRMKTYYEDAYRSTLPRRMPVLLRLDGKAFHTFTRGMEKPFDPKFIMSMNAVAIEVCEEAQGAQFAYIQSDEITVLLHNYKRLNSEAWFDNNVQKIVSVSAAIASSAMTRIYGTRALFDARVFVVPEAEVVNAILWRQQDATRNSIQMLARSIFSHKELHKKDNSELQEMCFQAGHNWNDLPTHYRRGRFALRGERGWTIDNHPPILSADRNYVEKHLAVTDGAQAILGATTEAQEG